MPAQIRGLVKGINQAKWKHAFLTQNQAVIVTLLGQMGEVDILTYDFAGRPRDAVKKDFTRLVPLGLVGPVPSKPNFYSLLTRRCRVAVLPDGRYVAAEDISGRLSRWTLKFVEKWRKAHPARGKA